MTKTKQLTQTSAFEQRKNKKARGRVKDFGIKNAVRCFQGAPKVKQASKADLVPTRTPLDVTVQRCQTLLKGWQNAHQIERWAGPDIIITNGQQDVEFTLFIKGEEWDKGSHRLLMQELIQAEAEGVMVTPHVYPVRVSEARAS